MTLRQHTVNLAFVRKLRDCCAWSGHHNNQHCFVDTCRTICTPVPAARNQGQAATALGDIAMYCLYVYIDGWRERETERERERERERETDRETETDRQTDRDIDRDRQTDRERQRVTEKQREKQTHRECGGENEYDEHCPHYDMWSK